MKNNIPKKPYIKNITSQYSHLLDDSFKLENRKNEMNRVPSKVWDEVYRECGGDGVKCVSLLENKGYNYNIEKWQATRRNRKRNGTLPSSKVQINKNQNEEDDLSKFFNKAEKIVRRSLNKLQNIINQ